jgi:hypothetical protein
VLQGLGCLLRGGWSFVDDDEIRCVDMRHANATWLLPSYLQHVAINSFSLADSAGTFVEHVAADVCRWIEENYGCPEIVQQAASNVRQSETESQIDVFGELICQLVEHGWAELSRPGFRADGAFTILDEGIFIPKRGLSKLVEAKAHLSLDGLFLSRLLANSGQLVGETTHGGISGWIVSAPWLYSLHAGLQPACQFRVLS